MAVVDWLLVDGTGRVIGQPLSLQQAADRLGCSYHSALRAVKSGRLVAYRPAGRYVVFETDLRVFLEACRAVPDRDVVAPVVAPRASAGSVVRLREIRAETRGRAA